MPIRLHVNVDHVATLRQARGTTYPDPVYAAQVCESAGADGITIHLREDRRHIVDRDVARMRDAVSTLLNLECAATDEMVDIALRMRPDCVTFVPERREERTTEGGLDVVGQRAFLEPRVARLRDAKIKVSMFIAADAAQVEASLLVGAQQIELHTGPYAHARTPREKKHEIEVLARAAQKAEKMELEVAAGHGLTRFNVIDVAAIPEIEELNIGHAIVADAVILGMTRAVKGMRAAMRRGIRRRA
jgi:pyridoxine 5-phosphate synthase